MLFATITTKAQILDAKTIFLSVLVGISSVLGSLFAILSIRHAPNPGYSVAIYSANFVLLALTSILFFRSELTIPKLLGMLSIIFGIFLLSL
jgi:uncharacterized membrane protein